MKYAIEDARLVMTATADERAKLRADRESDPDGFGTEGYMCDLLEEMVTDDHFEWMQSFVTGDLTNAPMLAIYGEEEDRGEEPKVGEGLLLVGCDGDKFQCVPVTYRWSFMDYQITTPQAALLETGRAVWEGGELLKRAGQELSTRTGEVTLKFIN